MQNNNKHLLKLVRGPVITVVNTVSVFPDAAMTVVSTMLNIFPISISQCNAMYEDIFIISRFLEKVFLSIPGNFFKFPRRQRLLITTLLQI